ncbi:MAG: ATP-binding protein, partial [Verrucomicrobiales bacterium]
LPTLIVTALGGGLASLVARRIVHPLATLTRWLPNLDLDDPEALPEDVTGRTDEIGTLARSLEESRQRLRKEVSLRQQAERLAALGRIATSLAHEVRNPAAAIRLHADLLASNFDSLDTDSLDLIREEVDRITDLVNQWLYVARSAPPRTELHDLALLVRRVLHRLAPQFDHATVTASFAGDQYAPINVDAPRIEQVLRNLFINAMQAMPEGGAIQVEIEHDATGTTLEIRDEGPGFSEEACRRWREPFFSEREGGMGLGLTLAAEVMQGHGGTIGVSNQPGGGTVVRCQFPQP